MLSGVFKEKVVISGKKYYIKKQIGEGAFAYVYHVKAKQPAKGNEIEEYAIKKMICQTAEQKADALKEINVLKAVNNEYVMPYLDSDSTTCSQTHHTLIYIIMPICRLGTLQQFVTRGVFPYQSGVLNGSTDSVVDNAIRKSLPSVLVQALWGLQALHEVGYRHADFKPDNILIQLTGDNNGGIRALLTDFGSATAIKQVAGTKKERLAIQEYAAGYTTASYRAPELWDAVGQVSSNDDTLVIDGRADVWSFGCVLYAVLFASTPFESRTQGLSTLSILSGNFSIPSIDPATAVSTFYSVLITSCLNVLITNRLDMAGLLSRVGPMLTPASGEQLVEFLTGLSETAVAIPPTSESAPLPVPPVAASSLQDVFTNFASFEAPQSPAAPDAGAATPVGDIAGFGAAPVGDIAGFGAAPVGDIAGFGDDEFGDFTDFESAPTGPPATDAATATASASASASVVGTSSIAGTQPTCTSDGNRLFISRDAKFLIHSVLPSYEVGDGAVEPTTTSNELLLKVGVFVRRSTGFLRKTIARKSVCCVHCIGVYCIVCVHGVGVRLRPCVAKL